MDGRRFDNITKRLTRRGFVAAVSGMAAFLARDASASQPGPPTCGQSGDVCTMLIGCCSGFTCVTSAINVNYGVCVPGGSGGTVSTGTGLISPFSEDLEQEIAALQSDPALTATSTALTPEQKKAEIQARRDARQSRRSSRRSTRRSNIENRRTTRRTEQDQEEEAARIAAGPLIEGEIFNPGAKEGESSTYESLKVTNRDIGTIFVNSVEPILFPNEVHRFPDSNTPQLAVGESFLFVSGASPVDFETGASKLFWRSEPVCSGQSGTGAGFLVNVSFATNAPNRQYKFFCDTLFTPAPEREVSLTAANRKKRKRKQRARQRQKAKDQGRKSKKRKR